MSGVINHLLFVVAVPGRFTRGICMLAATYTMGLARAMGSQLTCAAYTDTEGERTGERVAARRTLVSESVADFRRHERKQGENSCVYGV